MRYLKRLELSGFKSFAKKSTLEFNSPVTAVVGPNGSGKSNIVEAVRFVLGEQSMKSMRGKSGSDLIFKGSRTSSSMSRASVSIVFDNRKKIFRFSSNSAISLDFDEIIITREVYGDGGNKYLINGTEVRLKDVVELLASVNIGSSGHHIISQGEADRILNANSKDRRSMIEDALGLKVYQFKIRESERKLDKTLQNLKEVQSLRREIAPHLSFLKKQVEKIEKAREMREELKDLYGTYLSQESGYLKHEEKELGEKKSTLTRNLHEIENALLLVEKGRKKEGNKEYEEALAVAEKKLSELRSVEEDLSRKLGRLEGMIEAEERRLKRESTGVESGPVPFREIEALVQSIEEDIQKGGELAALLASVRQRLQDFIQRKKGGTNVLHAEESKGDLVELKESQATLQKEVSIKKEEEENIRKEIAHIRESMESALRTRQEGEREYYELLGKKNQIRSDLEILKVREEAFQKRQTDFEEEIREGVVLIGPDAMRHAPAVATELLSKAEQEETRKKIERIKIRLEDVGGGGGGDVIKEYEETKARDSFLIQEMEDIEKSIESLKELIRDLKNTLDREFKEGIEKINTQFQEFFALMFGGGTAFLSVIVEHKKSRKKDEEEEEYEEESELSFDEGIEINVSMPHKKVKELQMLSGGERSLTSIALLFAISQVNPPPFLVLDETDAALDEANSRKYGNMLDNLSEYSQLIVVTHNRETMSRAQVLYGVTIGSDGASKLLSIQFEEALAVAK